METDTKSDQEGDSKDKKDDDEDMSLDQDSLSSCLIAAAAIAV